MLAFRRFKPFFEVIKDTKCTESFVELKSSNWYEKYKKIMENMYTFQDEIPTEATNFIEIFRRSSIFKNMLHEYRYNFHQTRNNWNDECHNYNRTRSLFNWLDI